MKYILASKSPRRREILANLGVDFEIVTADVDESDAATDPCVLVERLSSRKGEAVRVLLQSKGRLAADTVIIASDTVVSVDGKILGKPQDKNDARRMLTALSGRAHEVVSGVALLTADRTAVSHEVTEVTFRHLSAGEINAYIDTKEPFDKAGAYGLQDKASVFVEKINGDYFNVVGLPTNALAKLFKEATGVSL